MINLRKHWKTMAADDDDDDNMPPDDGSQTSPQTAPTDQSSMQTFTDGTAQKLCQRLWQGYITQDMTNFANFMLQLDMIATQFQQALPIPTDPADLEDATYDDSDDSLPSIGPTGDDADEE
jgi:hypothetical protein